MNEQEESLEQQIISSGGDLSEAEALARLARRLPELRQLPLMRPPAGFKSRQRIVRRRRLLRWSRRAFVLSGSMTTVALMAVVVVVAAQAAIPGDPLYSAKRASEAVALRLEPQFHEQMMMRRADEINQLVARHADAPLISAALTSYNRAVVRDPAASYAARDYCTGMLKNAATHADGSTRSQLQHSMSLLKPQNS